MMVRREWHPGRSHRELAEAWGIAVRTVAQRALEASRAIQIAGKVQDFVSQSLAELDTMQAVAMAEEKVVCVGKDEETKELLFERVPQPNVRAAAACVELKAKMMGALVVKHQVEDVSTVPTEKLRARAKELLAKLEQEENRDDR